MPKEKRTIQKEDIMSLEIYTSQRKEIRKKIVDFKKKVYEELLPKIKASIS